MMTNKLPVSEIKLNPNNPRIIKDDKFEKLVQSIKDFPEMANIRPVVLNKDHIILGGNMRFRAMKEAGWKEIPVAIVDLPEDKQREFVIKDNVSGGEWDWELLANEWDTEQLDDWGLDLPKDMQEEPRVEEDEAPEVSEEEPKSKLGEIYQLGNHRVMCGDSTKDYQTLLADKKVDMLFTDPPYGINLDTDYKGMPSRWNNKETYRNKFTKVAGDEKQVDMQFLQEIECKEMFLWGADYYAYSLPNSGANGTWYVWDKREDEDGSSYDKMMTAPFELCWGKKKRGKKFIRMRWAGFMSSDNAQGERPIGRVHPTQKPVALASWFIEKFSEPDWLILDLFGGAGFTLLSAEQTGRTAYLMELDPKYVDVIRKRWAKFVYPDTWEERWEELTPNISTGTAQNG